jgi:Mrp family chromosome partitioning ATPase
VHRDLGVTPEHGLVEHLAGERSLEEVIALDEPSGVHYLPIRRQTANPTDILSSQKMKQMLASLRERFDFIVLDSAPLLGVTDSKVVSLLTDRVLFVMRWEKTSKETSTNALAHLREAKATVAGVVLTQVDVRKHARYGYGDAGQYYGKYQKYYVN